VVVGVLFGGGIYLMMRRTLVQLLIGLGMIGNAANLLIFSASGLVRSRPPIVPEGADAPVPPYADPVPQALILTAIVISFGVIAFTLALADRAYREGGSDRISDLRESEE
jgi:multicomponent Na+:H+ antiporter subunit C